MTPAALRAWLAEHGMTQAEFARRLGRSLRAVQYWLADPASRHYRHPPPGLRRELRDLDRELAAERSPEPASR